MDLEPWQIGPVEPPDPTLPHLRKRYAEADAWEARTRIALDQARWDYAQALLAGRRPRGVTLRALERKWRHALRDLQRAEAALTGLLLRAAPAPPLPPEQ